MLDFFRNKLALIHSLNIAWIKAITADEDRDLPVELKKVVSETINFRYLWICSYKNVEPDLELYDLLPEYSWEELELDNGREIDSICDLMKDEFSAIAIFYPLLQGSIENIGKLEYVAGISGIEPPNKELLKVIL